MDVLILDRRRLSFLELNGIHIEAENEDVVRLGMGVAEGTMNQDDVLKWIIKNRS